MVFRQSTLAEIGEKMAEQYADDNRHNEVEHCIKFLQDKGYTVIAPVYTYGGQLRNTYKLDKIELNKIEPLNDEYLYVCGT